MKVLLDDIVWKSDNESIAAVETSEDGTGIVTPRAGGTVTITGTMGKFSQ